ncbi:VQ motif-containing protein 9-like [Salvia hispanica]|uniref:VQ motif-containing protein 9-like n=1 Tax=Salvia hispanica TaxID=49212 RepID=UPI002009BA36|nr:VQ motif-containing protein 9-like [Salvia hispanica]XP_047968292.1 VQ motif-containing protein 9-like [Salvia hispanica]
MVYAAKKKMDNGFDDSASSAAYSNTGSSSISSRDAYLKQLSRNSHKIAKPNRKPLPLPPAASLSDGISILEPNSANSQPQSQQPPVYNINKSDFRDVVQRLTGSPSHERFAAPQTRPPSSRLQRIRPPPLSQIFNRPPPILPQNGGVSQPFTPLPPLPSVHPAAESPVSAYMRFLQSSAPAASASYPWPTPPRHPEALIPQSAPPPESPVSAYMRFLTASPQWNAAAPQQFPAMPPFPAMPLSPLAFGCIPSPKSPYGALFSPTGQLGLPQLPLSPTPPVSSPRWKGM